MGPAAANLAAAASLSLAQHPAQVLGSKTQPAPNAIVTSQGKAVPVKSEKVSDKWGTSGEEICRSYNDSAVVQYSASFLLLLKSSCLIIITIE